jgi:broad specificity phosphatase PhoE
MPATLFLMRHGETVWNRDQRFQGQRDSPLTARGLDQARRMGATLAHHIPDRAGWTIVASPLGRAQHTARIICQVVGFDPVQIASDARLNEVDVGDWAGLTHEEIEAASPGVLDGSTRYDWIFRAPHGETYDDMTERVCAFLADAGSAERLIVVAHGVTGRLLRSLYLDLPKEDGLALEASQDAIFRLSGGAVDRIPCLAW